MLTLQKPHLLPGPAHTPKLHLSLASEFVGKPLASVALCVLPQGLAAMYASQHGGLQPRELSQRPHGAPPPAHVALACALRAPDQVEKRSAGVRIARVDKRAALGELAPVVEARMWSLRSDKHKAWLGTQCIQAQAR